MSKKKSLGGMKLGERISALRQKKGFSLSELARKIGVSHVQISYYEKGDQIPNAILMSNLAEVLDTTFEYLIKGEEGDRLNLTVPRIRYLSKEDQNALMIVIEGFLSDREFKKVAKGPSLF